MRITDIVRKYKQEGNKDREFVEVLNEVANYVMYEQAIVKKDNDGTNNSKMIFAISFMADDEKVCKAVNDVIKEYVDGLNEKFNETYGEGNVNLLSSQISSSGSSEILAKKMEELTNYETIKNKYFELKNGVSKEQIMIYKKVL